MSPLPQLADRWPAISALLDEGLAPPPGARPQWLSALAGQAADLREPPVPHVALAQARVGLAECQIAQQQWGAALQTLRETARQAEAALGLDSPSTILAQSRLAAGLHATGQRAQARQLHEQALRRVLLTKGAGDTLFTPIVRIDLAQSLLAEGRLREALVHVNAVVASRREHYAGSATLGSGLRIQAVVLTGLQRPAEARALFAEALSLWRKGSGSGMLPWRFNRFHLDEARLDLAVGDPAAALARLAGVAARPAAEALAVAADDVERDLLAATAHRLQGDTAQALELARAAHGRLVAAPLAAAQPALLAEASLVLGQSMLGAGQPLAAQPLIAAALAWRRSHDAPGSPGIADARRALGQAHAARAAGSAGRRLT